MTDVEYEVEYFPNVKYEVKYLPEEGYISIEVPTPDGPVIRLLFTKSLFADFQVELHKAVVEACMMHWTPTPPEINLDKEHN